MACFKWDFIREINREGPAQTGMVTEPPEKWIATENSFTSFWDRIECTGHFFISTRVTEWSLNGQALLLPHWVSQSLCSHYRGTTMNRESYRINKRMSHHWDTELHHVSLSNGQNTEEKYRDQSSTENNNEEISQYWIDWIVREYFLLINKVSAINECHQWQVMNNVLNRVNRDNTILPQCTMWFRRISDSQNSLHWLYQSLLTGTLQEYTVGRVVYWQYISHFICIRIISWGHWITVRSLHF